VKDKAMDKVAGGKCEGVHAKEEGGSTNDEKAGAEGKGEEELGSNRRNGNVARLPKEVRDRINVMIRDGVTYRQIIERLGEDGKGLDRSNMSRWKDGGYEDWLLEQAFIARTRARQETPGELVKDFDATEVNHAALQLGTLHIFDALRDMGPGSLNKKLGGDCAAFARLINALARSSRETMLLQKYREACARARAALTQLKDPNRKFNESETRAIVREVDNILGLQSVDEEGAGWEESKVGEGESKVQGPKSKVGEGEEESTVHSPQSTAGEGGERGSPESTVHGPQPGKEEAVISNQ